MGIHDRDYWREASKRAESRAPRRARPRGDWQAIALRAGTWLVAILFVFMIVKALMDRRGQARPAQIDTSSCHVVSRGPIAGKPDRDAVVLDCPRR